MRTAPPNHLSGDRYRTIDERDIIELLLVAAQPFELKNGARATATIHTAKALDRWVNAGLGFRLSENGERLFDPVEVINQMKWLGLSGKDNFWSEDFVRTSRMFTRTFAEGGRTGIATQAAAPAHFSVVLRRHFDLRKIANRTKVRLRIPLPIASTACDIDVSPILPETNGVSVSHSNGRLEFQIKAAESAFVTVGAKIHFTTSLRSNNERTEHLTPASEELYLRPSEGLIKVTPRIKELSQSLGGQDGTWEVALKCSDYVLSEFCCGMIHYDLVDAAAPGDWVIDTGWYDCQLGSALFISMCRARGIPARLISGYMLYELAPGFHYWAEVWIAGRGWVPFDFLNWDLSEGGRDPSWRTHFAGKIDYRMITQCLPLIFTGPPSVRFPPAWHLLNAATIQGMKITFCDLDGSLIYTDDVSVRRSTQ